MLERPDFLLNRLNYEPIQWMGCSQSEVTMLSAIIGGPILLIGGLFGYLAWGNIPFGMVPALLVSVAAIFIGMKVVTRIKRDKEPGFLQQVITDKLESSGVKKTDIIRRSGYWSVGEML